MGSTALTGKYVAALGAKGILQKQKKRDYGRSRTKKKHLGTPLWTAAQCAGVSTFEVRQRYATIREWGNGIKVVRVYV